MKAALVKLMRDRLIWFALMGGALFALNAWVERRAERHIYIDLPLVEKLAAQWEGQMRRPASRPELGALIDNHIREEILVREARRLGLDGDDSIIRRRLAQKASFLLEGAPPALPAEAVLQTWFAANRARYDVPPRRGFRHIYAEDAAGARAALALVRQVPKNWRGLGQPFMLDRDYPLKSELELARLMGADFAAQIFASQQTGWFGPARSGFGWHIVQITARDKARKARFSEMADKVARDWQEAQMRDKRAALWQDLRARYRIELAPLDPSP